MSVEQIDALFRSAEQDSALADVLRRAGGLEAVVEIGTARGYTFTEDELTAYFDRVAPAELSEQELASVSGGAANSLAAESPNSALQYKLDRCIVKNWSTGG